MDMFTGQLPAVHWDEQRVKALLTEPELLLEDEAYSEWIRQQGGLNNVYAMLRALPLSDKQRKVLKVMLDKPGASLQEYALILHVSVATYVRHRTALFKALAAILNAHLLERYPAGEEQESPSVLNNLPPQYLPIVGRDNEIKTLCSLLMQENVRLLTIAGPGGIGKTRLAIQVASELLPHFRDGVFFVSLSTLTDPNLVGPTIAQILDIKAENHVGYEMLKEYLRGKRVLLVLDNFEQVGEAAPLLNRLLADAPRLKILVTSRAILHLYSEFEFSLPPLEIPDPSALPSLEALAQVPSVALFVTRARMAQSDFALTSENAPFLAEICARLEGIPLAIELAAARVKLFSPSILLRELHHALSVLSDRNVDVLPRHQSMRDTIEWSYRLLSPEEQQLYAHVGVFVGGFTLEAVEAVWIRANRPIGSAATLELLASLIDKSMLLHRTSLEDEPRFDLLEILREYALEQLRAGGQEEITRQRHLHYYCNLAERLEKEGGVAITSNWLKRLEVEHDNLRAALQWALTTNDHESALRIAGAIWRFWQIHGHVEEGSRWMRTILERSRGEPSLPRCKALWGAGWLGMVGGILDWSRSCFEEGVEIARQMNEPHYYGLCLLGVGAVERALGEFDQAQAAFDECLALFQKKEDWENVAWTLEHLGVNALEGGFFDQAISYFSQALDLFNKLDMEWACAEALTFLGHATLQQQRYVEAQEFYQKALALYEDLDDQILIVNVRLYLGATLFGAGKFEDALRLYRENLSQAYQLRHYWGVAWGIERLAEVAKSLGKIDAAARLWGAAHALRSLSGSLWPPGFRGSYTERRFLSLEAQLGAETWQKLWEEGHKMNMGEAVQLALEVALTSSSQGDRKISLEGHSG